MHYAYKRVINKQGLRYHSTAHHPKWTFTANQNLHNGMFSDYHRKQQQDTVPLRPTVHWLIPCISFHGTPLRLRAQWSPINICSGNASRIIHSEAYFMLRWLIAWDSERFWENLRVCVCLPPHNPQWLLQHASRHFEKPPIPASPPPPLLVHSHVTVFFLWISLCALDNSLKFQPL